MTQALPDISLTTFQTALPTFIPDKRWSAFTLVLEDEITKTHIDTRLPKSINLFYDFAYKVNRRTPSAQPTLMFPCSARLESNTTGSSFPADYSNPVFSLASFRNVEYQLLEDCSLS
ncbi:hypothetical protein J6590_042001 [Homalodisca vitripennis]|nr:hypothetical protein J6590_042001 [Homalodisca vitripennis]